MFLFPSQTYEFLYCGVDFRVPALFDVGGEGDCVDNGFWVGEMWRCAFGMLGEEKRR